MFYNVCLCDLRVWRDVHAACPGGRWDGQAPKKKGGGGICCRVIIVVNFLVATKGRQRGRGERANANGKKLDLVKGRKKKWK